MSVALPPGMTVLERGWLSSNNVLLRSAGGDGALLVDTGYVTHAPQTVALVESCLQGASLQTIVNTHLHSDHCGGNAAVMERFGADLLIPPGDFEAALHWDEAALSFKDTGQLCDQFKPSGMLQPGATLPAPFDEWEVHAAPGHDPASVVLFQRSEGVLISADALWENGFGIVFPELDGRDAFGEVEATLLLIEQLRPRLVIPGHGAPFQDAEGALARAHQRLNHFRREPERHARHAAKALVMFHVLERGQVLSETLADWVARTPIFQRVCAGLFSEKCGTDAQRLGFAQSLLDDLEKSGVLVAEPGLIGGKVLRPR